jgi:hypothetical protein
VLFVATFVPVPISLNVPETPQKPAQSYEVMYHGDGGHPPDLVDAVMTADR